MLREAAERAPDAPALVAGSPEAATRRRWTYSQLLDEAERTARALLGRFEPGERVATLAWNGYRHLEAYYGTTGFGAVCHTINPRLFPDQIAYIVNHADDAYVMFDAPFAPLVDALAPQGVTYTPQRGEAVAAVDRGEAEAAFLLRPTRIEDVFTRAREGRVLPQKTTYFFPKLTSGLLLQPLD